MQKSANARTASLKNPKFIAVEIFLNEKWPNKNIVNYANPN